MDATIIISTFNRPDFLGPLLNSILKQETNFTFEVIVVEAGSHESFKIVKDVCQKFGISSVYHFEGCSLGESRNIGVTKASGNWCFFADDDDVWARDKIDRVLSIADKFDVVSHMYLSSTSPELAFGSDLGGKGTHITLSAFSLATHLWGNRYGGGSSLSARRSFLLAIKFNEDMQSCEDIEWIMRTCLSGARMGFVSAPLVCYRIHERRMTGVHLRNAYWEWRLIKWALAISVGLGLGSVLKFSRILVRVIIRR